VDAKALRDPGFLFMLGIYGKRPSRQTVALLRDTGACGVLLLARNIESPAQIRSLTQGIMDRLGRPLLFAIDHEGGWVLRFQTGLTAFPGNAALGRTRDAKLAYSTGRQMALELAPLGIGMNLAPVLDVGTGRYNPGIGIRSFGDDPALVGRLGSAFLRGLQDHGVAACAKHFPGKGAATVDAHVSLPTIRLPRAEFMRTHLAPFSAAVRSGVAAIMTSHVRCPALDSKPVSFSRRITHDLIRRKLGFRGAIISDDLCMGAITTRGPIPLAAWESFQAGHDIIIIAHEPSAQRESVELLRARHDGSALPAAGRIERLLSFPRSRRRADPKAGARLARETARQAVAVARRGVLSLPLKADGAGTLVLFPDFAQVRDRFTFEGGPRGPEARLRLALRSCPGARWRRTPITASDIQGLRSAIGAARRVVCFCFEAMRFPGQKAVLKLINQTAAPRSVVCLIRSSFDLGLLDRRVTVVDAYGYRDCQLEAALHLIFKEECP